MYRNSVIAFAAAAFLAASSWAGPTDLIERSFKVSPGGLLKMEVDRGSIHITSGGADEVSVRVKRELRNASEKKAADAFELHRVEIEQDGESVHIHSEGPKGGGSFFRKNPLNNLQVQYDISVPEKFNLNLQTGGGNVDVSRLTGEINVKTGGGNISLDDAHGRAEIHTGGGNLRVGKLEGDLVARSGGGSISIGSVKGGIDAQTGGGDVRVEDAAGSVKLQTGGGNLSAALSAQPKAASALRSGGGNISVTLPDQIAVDLQARTGGGRVRSDFDGEMNKERTHLRAQLNGGGPELRLETGGGSVQIVRR